MAGARASLEWKTRSVVGAVEDFAPMLIGEDPTRIEHLYQKMYRQSFWRMGVIGMSGIAAIEQACWDILGKSLGQTRVQTAGRRGAGPGAHVHGPAAAAT